MNKINESKLSILELAYGFMKLGYVNNVKISETEIELTKNNGEDILIKRSNDGEAIYIGGYQTAEEITFENNTFNNELNEVIDKYCVYFKERSKEAKWRK